jgi:hypothetical protein
MTSNRRRAVATRHYLIPLALGQYTPVSSYIYLVYQQGAADDCDKWRQAVALLASDLYVHGAQLSHSSHFP